MTLSRRAIEITQYFILVVVLSFVSIIFSKTASNLGRFYLISMVSTFYFFWGLWHHHEKDRVDKLIVLEYLLVSAIIIILGALGLGIIRFF